MRQNNYIKRSPFHYVIHLPENGLYQRRDARYVVLSGGALVINFYIRCLFIIIIYSRQDRRHYYLMNHSVLARLEIDSS
jgi:hypothetical protein